MRPLSSQVALVARREVTERVRTRSFRISTLIYVLLGAAAVAAPRIVAEPGPTVYDVALVGAAAEPVGPALVRAGRAAGVEVRPRVVRDRARAEAALRSGDVDLALLDGGRALARGGVPDVLRSVAGRALVETRVAERLGSTAREVLDAPPLAVERLEAESTRARANRPLVFVGTTLTYFMVLSYGMVVAIGVLEEKSSRVSELIVAAVAPSRLLAGKIVGIGLVAVIQLAVVGAAVVASAALTGSLGLPRGTPLTFLSVPVWIVLGYGLYSSLYAAAAATAGRPEELGNSTAPLTFVILASYFVAVAAGSDPDGSLARVASFVPLMAPMTMLPRAALGEVAAWEVPVSMGLVVLTTVAMVRVSSRVYTGAIGRRAGRVRVREAWRGART